MDRFLSFYEHTNIISNFIWACNNRNGLTAIRFSIDIFCKSAIILNSKPVLCFKDIPSLNGKAIESITMSFICKINILKNSDL